MADRELVFYHAPFTRSATVRWMMEELGVPHRMEVLNLKKGEHRTEAYRSLNPMAKVPTITHGEVVVSEVAAILCYLADAFPDAELAPTLDDPRRGHYLKWLFFAPGCIEPAMMDYSLQREPGPSTRIGYGDFDRVLDTIEASAEPGPWLLGEQFTAADVMIGSSLRWAKFSSSMPERSGLDAYLERATSRPAARRAMAADAELAKQLQSG